MKRYVFLLAVALAGAGLGAEATAGTKAGKEFRINTFTQDYQRNPAVANLSNGFVAAWESTPGQDGDGDGVYARRYNARGKAKGTEFRVNTHTADDQSDVAVTGLSKGGFLVVWNSENQDGSGYGIYAQRYSSKGGRRGKEFRVNTYTTSDQRFPVVAGLSDGGFVVAWESNGQDGSSYGVYAQMYNAKGKPRGSEFLVNRYTTNTQLGPAVAALAKGGFVVNWSSYMQDGSSHGVFAQVYNAKGKTVGDEIPVNTYTDNFQWHPAVAGLSAGGFVIMWDSLEQDGSGLGIYGQRFNAKGKARGKEFRVNRYTDSIQAHPTVAGLTNGGFVAMWESSGQDGSGFGVFGLRFNASGKRKGKEFQVNTHTTVNQRYASVARLPNSGFVAIWESWGSQDGDDTGIYGQRFKR